MDSVKFDRFSGREYATIQRMIQESPEKIPLGGVYYGQVRVGDLCYHATIGHIPPEGKEWGSDTLHLAFLAFMPHDAMDMSESYFSDLMDGHKVDYVFDADITFSKEEVLSMDYEAFTEKMERLIGQRVFDVKKIQEPAGRTTTFWADVDRYGKEQNLIPKLSVQSEQVTMR